MKNNENISMNGFFEKKLCFFGLKGGLPLSFTDRILYNEDFDNIDNFFDEMLFILEEFKSIQHSCLIPMIKKRIIPTCPSVWKIIKINSYNRIGIDRIGQFIIGCQKRYLSSKNSLISLGHINFIKLYSVHNS